MKKTTVAIILLASLNNIFGQNQYDPSIKNVPTSPEVALLGRFGNIPVGHYTGTANVSIPLYNLKVDDLEIPLALSYHTSGIKVADEATWVGLGWNFMPEGTITQEIRGKEDYVSGGDGFSTATGYDIFKSHFPTLFAQSHINRLQVGYNDYNSGGTVGTNPAVDDSNDIILRLNEKKGQPDIFTYNFYGYSGKFFYNPENNSEILFMESNDDVKFTRNTQGWIATTNKGDKFYFYAIEKSKTDQTSYTDIGYTFKISQIVLTSGKTITFTYQNESTNQLYPVQVAHITNFSSNTIVNTSSNATTNEKKTLTGIETDDTKIEFNLDNREDIRPQFPSIPIKKLSSIDIKSKYPNKKIKSFVFGTTYFNPTVNTPEEGYKFKRLKLNSIQEVNYNETGAAVQSSPPYSFEYDMSKTMPSKIFSSDFYGYNNGSNSNVLVPDLAFFNYFSQDPYKNYGMTPTFYSGTSRYTDKEYIKTYILTKVIYPTSARTEFEYESNTFGNQFVPAIGQLISPLKSINLTHRGASVVPGGQYFIESPTFKITQTQSITFQNTIFDGFFGPNYPETHYGYYDFDLYKCKIQFLKRKTVNGQPVTTLIKEWTIDVGGDVFEQTHSRVWNETMQMYPDSDLTTEYYVRVENPIQYRSNDGMHRALVSSNVNYYDESEIDKSISYGNGVRIKSIKNYENTTLLSYKEYGYQGGRLTYPFQPLNFIRGATYKSQPTNLNGGCFIENISIFNDLSIDSNDMGIGGNKPFGYSQVTEKDINVLDGTLKGSTVYYFTNEAPVGLSLKGVPKVDIPSNGENTFIEMFDKDQNKLSTKQNIYDNLPNTYGVYPSFSSINTSIGPVDPGNNYYPYTVNGCPVIGLSYTGNTVQNPLGTTKYNFIFNPLITGKRRLMRTFDTSYFGNKEVVDKTEFFYTTAGNLDISKKTTPDGKIIETNYDYAGDMGNNRLVNNGMTGIALNTQVTSDNKILNHAETKYDNPDNYLPSSVVSYNLLSGTPDTEVTYNKYDNKGNLLQYSGKDGIPVSIIWGYNNTKPIAKIQGITYDQAIALSGYADIVARSNEDINATTQNTLIDTLDTFRTNSSRYYMSTYTYDPLVGVTSITPPSGIREIYIYDAANRLKEVRENNLTGKLLKEFKYNYKN
ncbi:RHS repeat domain-containing protein [Chryseobacterium paludis]|uniref:hypothetical protein n=1 Tax=Chryseobacterium paludis TaxID=2956784 RepID=UPI0021C1F5AD|nr:hypothetical protein [Chryseobacterium paludis]